MMGTPDASVSVVPVGVSKLKVPAKLLEPLEPEEVFVAAPPPPSAPPAPSPPSQIEDDEETNQLDTIVCGYRIGSLVGRGGMSVVFRVTHPMLSEELAMKVVIDQRLQDEVAATAIYAHAKTMATISSSHVVRTIDAGRLPSGEPFIVMERLEGPDLAAHLKEQERLSIGEALRFAMQACDGLAHAHGEGLVHGDIKPSNLIITKDGRGLPCLKIIDFSPAVPRASDPNDPFVTCSPGYAAPEQLGARKDVDARADVWALGIVLYEIVTGKRAYDVTSLAEMVQVIGKAPESLSKLRPDAPADLEAVVKKCLATDREDRYADVHALRDALADLSDREMLSARARVVAAAQPITARTSASASASPAPPVRASRLAAMSPWQRRVFLGALGPLSALVSMSVVRVLLALVH